jgi:hypothetical protein
MNHAPIIVLVALCSVAAAPRAQAQERTQNEAALHLIGGALGGGIFGVAGVLTRFAIEDAARQRNEQATRPAAGPVSATYVYSSPSDSRWGVQYNKPCANFDPGTGRLLSCDPPIDSFAATDLDGGAAPMTRPRRFATSVHVPHLRSARRYGGPRTPIRQVHAFRGGRR